MRTLIAALVLPSLLVTGVTGWADGGAGGAHYPLPTCQGWRVDGGRAWPKDEGQQTVLGVGYIWKHALVTANYAQGNRRDLTVGLGAVHHVRDTFWSLEASYLWRPKGDPTVYAGGGWGVVWMNRDDLVTLVTYPPSSLSEERHATSGIGNLVVGKEFPLGRAARSALFLEARYNFAAILRDDSVHQDVNLQGWRLVAGWRF